MSVWAAPLADGLHARLARGSDFLIPLAGGGQEHDLGAEYQPRRSSAGPRPPLQRSSVLVRNYDYSAIRMNSPFW